MRGAPAEVAARERRGTPAEAAASDREGRATPKREGSDGEEDERIARRDWPMRGEGKNCLGKRREKLGGPMG